MTQTLEQFFKRHPNVVMVWYDSYKLHDGSMHEGWCYVENFGKEGCFNICEPLCAWPDIIADKSRVHVNGHIPHTVYL